MNVAQAITRMRQDLHDVSEPYLWSDDELYMYLTDAQLMYCRYTDGISDSTSAVSRLFTIAGDPNVPLHETVLKVRSARRATDNYRIELINFEDIEDGNFRGFDESGAPKQLVLGMDEKYLRVVPTPDAGYEIKLSVFRMPRKDISADTAQFEVRAEHHEALLWWARAVAHRKADAETYNLTKAEALEEKFIAYCRGLAKREQGLRRHKRRTVRYGGI